MRNKTISLMLLFFAVALYGQKKSKIRLTYNVSLKTHNTDSVLTRGQKKYNKFADKVGKKTYILDIINEQSVFRMKKNMDIEIDNKSNLISASVGSGSYYYNTKLDVTLNKKNVLGEEFIVKSKVKYNWILSQEKKKIGAYMCFKATALIKIINRIGQTKTKKIIAWYYPNISINVGIKDYHGLPGIIIFLDDGGVFYECIKVEINLKESITITRPIKGKVISEKEYNDILLRNFKRRF